MRQDLLERSGQHCYPGFERVTGSGSVIPASAMTHTPTRFDVRRGEERLAACHGTVHHPAMYVR